MSAEFIRRLGGRTLKSVRSAVFEEQKFFGSVGTLPSRKKPFASRYSLFAVVFGFGGCFPSKTQSRRNLTHFGSFNFRASTVARPQEVRPMMRVPSLLQRKCLSHFCLRGLNKGTTCPVSGSIPDTWIPLFRLHRLHAMQRFRSSFVPPFTNGMMWSICNSSPNKSS
jgi:hypothetical protein